MEQFRQELWPMGYINVLFPFTNNIILIMPPTRHPPSPIGYYLRGESPPGPVVIAHRASLLRRALACLSIYPALPFKTRWALSLGSQQTKVFRPCRAG